MNRSFAFAMVAILAIAGCATARDTDSTVPSPSIVGAVATTTGAGPTPTPSATLTPAQSPSLLPATGALEPGTYYRLTDVGDAAGGISGDQPVGVARFTFTVPEGWATAEEGSFVYRESPQRPRDPAAVGEVLLTIWTVSHVYTDACHHEATLVDAGTTTDELASLLVAQKGRVASAATDVTLGASRPSGSS